MLRWGDLCRATRANLHERRETDKDYDGERRTVARRPTNRRKRQTAGWSAEAMFAWQVGGGRCIKRSSGSVNTSISDGSLQERKEEDDDSIANLGH